MLSEFLQKSHLGWAAALRPNSQKLPCRHQAKLVEADTPAWRTRSGLQGGKNLQGDRENRSRASVNRVGCRALADDDCGGSRPALSDSNHRSSHGSRSFDLPVNARLATSSHVRTASRTQTGAIFQRDLWTLSELPQAGCGWAAQECDEC